MTSAAFRARPPRRSNAPQPTPRFWAAVLEQCDRSAFGLLCMAILTYIAVIFAVSNWELHTLRMGFDPLVYEQPLWNTLRGRIAEQSALTYTTSAFGQDLFLFHFVLVPFYALVPTTATLLFLQTVATAAGAIPLYLLVRDLVPGRSLPALLTAVCYLCYLPLQNVNTYEVQPRLFAATLLLFAYWFLTRANATGYWACLLLALTNRNDTALVVAALGLYGVLYARDRVRREGGWGRRRQVLFGWLPFAAGVGYWLLTVFVIVPAIAGGAQFSYLQNYDWLGANVGEIARTMITRPGYVFGQVFGADRAVYALQLLMPLALLPLFAPRELLPALPPFLLNILAGPDYAYQRDIFHQYSSLIIPWLFVAAVVAVAHFAAGSHPLLRLPPVPRLWRRRGGRDMRAAVATTLLCLALTLTVAQQVTVKPNRLGSFLRDFDDRRAANRAESVDILAALIEPPDAPLAVTNLAATRVPLRRSLYLFPGGKFYGPTPLDRVEYVLGDRRANGGEPTELDILISSGQWQVVKVQGEFQLLRRAHSRQSAVGGRQESSER